MVQCLVLVFRGLRLRAGIALFTLRLALNTSSRPSPYTRTRCGRGEGAEEETAAALRQAEQVCALLSGYSGKPIRLGLV